MYQKGVGAASPKPSDFYFLYMERTRFRFKVEPGDYIELITQDSSKEDSKTIDEPGKPFCYLRIEEPTIITIQRKNDLKHCLRARARVTKKDIYKYISKKSQSNLQYNQIIQDSPKSLFPEEVFNIPPTGSNIAVVSSLFDTFWKHYPKKVSKGQALTAWNKLCKKPIKERPTWRVVKMAILKQKESELWKLTPQYIPNPSTWLNQSRWLNDPKEMKAFRDLTGKKPFVKWEGKRYDLCPDGRYRNIHGELYIE